MKTLLFLFLLCTSATTFGQLGVNNPVPYKGPSNLKLVKQHRISNFICEDTSTTMYWIDSIGRVTKEENYFKGELQKSKTHIYNKDKSLVIKTITDNLEEDTKYRIPEKLFASYEYDKNNNISTYKIIDSRDSIIELSHMEYDNENRITRITYEVVPIRFRKSKPNMTYDSIAYNVKENLKTTYTRKPTKKYFKEKTKPIIPEKLLPEPGENTLVVERDKKDSKSITYYDFDEYGNVIKSVGYLIIDGNKTKTFTTIVELIYEDTED